VRLRPYLELFARGTRKGWTACGNQADAYEPTWKTYANHSASERKQKTAKAATLFDL
jgi:N6-adenosine-specific RNA methylase IME4